MYADAYITFLYATYVMHMCILARQIRERNQVDPDSETSPGASFIIKSIVSKKFESEHGVYVFLVALTGRIMVFSISVASL